MKYHWSDCSLHNMPAMPNKPCNCGGDAPPPKSKSNKLKEGEIMKIPEGKTKVKLMKSVSQSQLEIFDVGYIDGYAQAADERPYAVFVRVRDGLMDMVTINSVVAF
jgi:hypothetical protein|tara:strand:- start:440 stop:757 length:318 start_codon:yes stop_codon:yes gene_type:complete